MNAKPGKSAPSTGTIDEDGRPVEEDEDHEEGEKPPELPPKPSRDPDLSLKLSRLDGTFALAAIREAMTDNRAGRTEDRKEIRDLRTLNLKIFKQLEIRQNLSASDAQELGRLREQIDRERERRKEAERDAKKARKKLKALEGGAEMAFLNLGSYLFGPGGPLGPNQLQAAKGPLGALARLRAAVHEVRGHLADLPAAVGQAVSEHPERADAFAASAKELISDGADLWEKLIALLFHRDGPAGE